MSSARYEARLQVEDAERAADMQWRLSGSDPATRDAFVDRELRERLEDALTAVVPLEARIARFVEEVREAADVVGDLKLDGFEQEVERAASSKELEKWPSIVGELVTALAERVRGQADELKRLKDEATDVATLARPGARRPRSKVGATTLALPFLAAANDESVTIRDVPPSPIGPVKNHA